MSLALAALLCLASGFVVVCLGWSRRSPLAADILLRLSLSVGFGFGILSIAYFFSRVFGVENLLLADAGVLALLLVVLVLLRLRASTANIQCVSSEAPVESIGLRRTLSAAFAIALGGAIYSAVMHTLAHPQGEGWDAFAIWNLHARFLFRGGPYWREGFSSAILWCHPDYPLLLPASVAHFWSFLGRESTAVPAVIGLLFTFSTVGVLISGLSILRGHPAAMLGGITLLTTPSFLEHGTSQYADTPLSFFYLSTIVLLAVYDHRADDDRAGKDSKSSAGVLALAGLAAGFAAWTKNEGLLFFSAIVLARCSVRVSGSESLTARLRQIPPMLLSAAPVLGVLYFFKHFVAPVGGELSEPATILHRALDAVAALGHSPVVREGVSPLRTLGDDFAGNASDDWLLLLGGPGGRSRVKAECSPFGRRAGSHFRRVLRRVSDRPVRSVRLSPFLDDASVSACLAGGDLPVFLVGPDQHEPSWRTSSRMRRKQSRSRARLAMSAGDHKCR